MELKSIFRGKKPRIRLRAILQLCRELELRAEELYRGLEQIATDSETKKACSVLSKEEKAHAAHIGSMLDHWADLPLSTEERCSVQDDASEISALFFSQPPTVDNPINVLKYALEEEKKSITLYEDFQDWLDREFLETHERYSASDDRKLRWKTGRISEMIQEERQHMNTIALLLTRWNAPLS